jgi:hypothetical protein
MCNYIWQRNKGQKGNFWIKEILDRTERAFIGGARDGQ